MFSRIFEKKEFDVDVDFRAQRNVFLTSLSKTKTAKKRELHYRLIKFLMTNFSHFVLSRFQNRVNVEKKAKMTRYNIAQWIDKIVEFFILDDEMTIFDRIQSLRKWNIMKFRVFKKQLTIIIEKKIDENYFKIFVKYVIRRIFFCLWIVSYYDANHFSNLQKINIENVNRNEFKQWTLKRFKLNRINWLIFELIIINKKFLRLIILFKRDFHDSSLSVNERKIAVNALNKLNDKSKWKFRVFVHTFFH